MLLAFTACKNNPEKESAEIADEENIPDMHTSKIALDWQGVYSGMTPCADCEGIETNLSLNNESYTLYTRYAGKEDKGNTVSGTFSWNEDGNSITLDGLNESPKQFKVHENSLLQLDMNGDVITGDLADMYRLEKIDDQINGKWQLIELNGEPYTAGEKSIYINIDVYEMRINGNTGCNNINGQAILRPLNRISFSKIAATLMACPDMEHETKMMNVLNQADNYTMNENQLSLNKARMAPLARFERME